MRELESRLSELEGRHTDLSRSYESLQLEYSSVKSELDRLRKDSARTEGSASNTDRQFQSNFGQSQRREWEESKVEILDPVLFDVSAFCFDHDASEDHCRKE